MRSFYRRSKYISLAFTAFFAGNAATAQSGCTDPAATNYMASAMTNDGSCTYPVTHHTPTLKCQLPSAIPESSGVVWTDGKLWTHNDSGNPATFFSVDTTTGAVLQKVYVDNYSNTDWEDIAADSLYIYLGDCGNNNGTRTDLKILKIAKADIGSAAIAHVNAQAISFNYTDQTSFATNALNNYDCEAVISIGDSLYLFTKDRGDGKTRVYKLPKTPGSYPVSPYTTFNTVGMITGADYNPVKREVILIGYQGSASNSFLWFLNDFVGNMFFSGNKRRVEIGNGQTWQTEGVCYINNGRYFISCETDGNINASVFVDTFSWAPAPHSNKINRGIGLDELRIFPNPTRDMINVNDLAIPAIYILKDAIGREVKRGKLNPGNNQVSIKIYPPAIYTIIIQGEHNEWAIKKIKKE